MIEYIDKWSVINRLIDLENEFQRYKPFHGFEHAMYRKICEAEIAIGKMPAADVEPVRHGHWVQRWTGNEYIVFCSKCRTEAPEIVDYELEYNYCPNCGAKMDEEVHCSD